MMQDALVSPMQLLVRTDREGEHLVVVPNPSGARPATFESQDPKGPHVPRIGSSTLLRIAHELAKRDFYLVRFEMTDGRGNHLTDEEASELSVKLRYLTQVGHLWEAEELLRKEGPYFVGGLEVHGSDGTRATLRRNGVLISRPSPATFKAVTDAWLRVRDR